MSKYYRPKDRTDGLDLGIQEAVKQAWETQVKMIYDRGYEDGCQDTKDEDYLKGFNAGYEKGLAFNTEFSSKKAYERGLDDAWCCVRKIFKLPCETAQQLFHTAYYPEILDRFSASEAINGIKDLEEKQKQDIDVTFDEGYEQGYNDCKVELTEEAKAHYNEGYKDGTKARDGERGSIYYGGYGDGLKDGYEKGLQHGQELRAKETECAQACGMKRAWEAARKIVLTKENGGIPLSDLNEIFGAVNVLKEFSASEAIEKIEAWEKKKKQEGQEQTEKKKNCKECEVYLKASSGKLTVKEIEKICIDHPNCDEAEWKLGKSGVVPAPPLVDCKDCAKYQVDCNGFMGSMKLHCTAFKKKHGKF